MRRPRGAALVGVAVIAVMSLAACDPGAGIPVMGGPISSTPVAEAAAATGPPSAAPGATDPAGPATSTDPAGSAPASSGPVSREQGADVAVSKVRAPASRRPTTRRRPTARPPSKRAAGPTSRPVRRPRPAATRSAVAAPATTPPRPATSARPSTATSTSRATVRPGREPVVGNPDGTAPVPAEGREVDTSTPTRVVGTGTAAGCTSAAVVEAVAAGGVVTFDCGPDPVTITLTETAKVRNTNPRLVLDGGGRVTLSGGGARRILYQNACDPAQGVTTTHCDDQETPALVLQNLTLADGNSTGSGDGGGAVFVRGGQFRVVNSRFVRNRCEPTGTDLGGAALRVFDLSTDRPAFVVGSTFGGSPGEGGVCSNGGAISSIGVSWTVLNSLFSHNAAIGSGANPARPGTPGGGSGGAIYLDGDGIRLRLAGTVLEDNDAAEGGGAVFFVSNDRTGTMSIDASSLRRNPSGGFETTGYPGVFFLGASRPKVTGGSTLSR